ncbi:MAG: GspMb/PilO family protein [Acidobacteriaceae bacterium]
MKLTMPDWKNVRITARHWHYAAVALLCLLNLGLAVQLAIAWKGAEAGNAARLEQHVTEYRTMQLKTTPLRGLDKKIEQARGDQDAFYEKRFPGSYSEVETGLGKLAVKNNVLLNRVQYKQAKPNEGVSEILIDASLSGDYAPVVRFINGLERDKIFFIVDGIALSGQQSGIVSLRMRLTTYLRGTEASSAGVPNAQPTAVATQAAAANHSRGGRR